MRDVTSSSVLSNIMKHFGLLALLCSIQYTIQKSIPADTSYVAAVVEYQVQRNSAGNLINYVNLIKDAAAQNADIVVFPEMTLTRGVSVAVPIYGLLKEYPIPALQPELYDEILVSISAAARQSEIYVVINVEEIMNCSDSSSRGEECPEQKRYLFNTNVVFDRTGAVIDRYRKINLFGEFTRTPALKPDLGIFETDFGVTFGHYICFDLMFQVPAVQVVEKMNITNIIFPTMWFSEMPYLTAVQIQQSYAYTMNVNFLGAGANNPKVGSAGSGIYSGKAGTLVSIMPGLPTTMLLVATVPKVPGKVTGNIQGPIYDDPNQDNLRLNTDLMLESQKTRLITNETRDFVLTDKDLVCHFRVRMSERNGETASFYRAFIQDGLHVYAKRNVGDVACAVVACKTEDPRSCVYRLSNNEDYVNIEELEIQMTTYKMHYNSTLKCNDIVYFPVSLKNNKFPLNPENITYIVNNVEDDFETTNEISSDRLRIRYRINSPQNNLISFGIWGRIYLRDGKATTNGSKEDIRQYIEVEKLIYSHDQGP